MKGHIASPEEPLDPPSMPPDLIGAANEVPGSIAGSIPYAGYIITSVGLQGSSPIEVPVLVVEDTAYNRKVIERNKQSGFGV